MGESEKGIESPIEILWQLIEESGKWTEELVAFARLILIAFIAIIVQSVATFSYVLYNSLREEMTPLPPYTPIIIVLIWLPSFVCMTLAALKLRRSYKNRVQRRDRWRSKFQILKNREEEIEKLLSEEAG